MRDGAALLYELLRFLIPFALYALLARMSGSIRWKRRAWRNARAARLLLGALVTTGIGLGLVGHFGGAPAGAHGFPRPLPGERQAGRADDAMTPRFPGWHGPLFFFLPSFLSLSLSLSSFLPARPL